MTPFDSLRQWQKPHAKALAARYFEHGTCHDGSDGGIGKTYIACAIAAEYNITPTIICPKSVVPSWRRVLFLFGVPANVYSYGLAWRRIGEFVPAGPKRMMKPGPDGKPRYKQGSRFVFKPGCRPQHIWFDECHRGNGETSNISKVMLAAKGAGCNIYTMSATPADNPLQMKALGYIHGLYKEKKHFKPVFVRQYGAYQDNFKRWHWNRDQARKLGYMKRLHDALYGGPGQRLRKADVPNFPRTIIDTKIIPGYDKQLDRMTKEMVEIYQQYEEEVEMTDAEVSKELKYRQMAELNKVASLVELAEDYIAQGFKVAYFVNFTETRFELCEQFVRRGNKVGEIEGSQSAASRQDYIDAFQNNELDVIVCQIDAGGEGVSLHDDKCGVPRVAFICPTYKAPTLHQVMQRVHRDGGGFSMQFLVYFDEGIEEKVADAVSNKLECMEMLNDGELTGFSLVKKV